MHILVTLVNKCIHLCSVCVLIHTVFPWIKGNPSFMIQIIKRDKMKLPLYLRLCVSEIYFNFKSINSWKYKHNALLIFPHEILFTQIPELFLVQKNLQIEWKFALHLQKRIVKHPYMWTKLIYTNAYICCITDIFFIMHRF